MRFNNFKRTTSIAVLTVFFSWQYAISQQDTVSSLTTKLEYLGSNVKTNKVEFPNMFLSGSSYYPEQWPQEQWESDFCKMKELGFNVVRMGEFAWSFFEPKEGEFNFEWTDKAIALAAKYQIKTIMCTPTANVPPWLRQKHPEVLGANSKGDFKLGARKGNNVNSKEYVKALQRITEAMAEHYGNHPDIIGWQLDNEPGYPFELYDDVSLVGFQQWLKQRYKTLSALNDAWGGAFWNLNYSAWEQIEFPTNRGDGGWNPGQKLDFRRFFSDGFANHLTLQSKILRKKIDSRFIFTNWPNLYWSVDPYQAGQNYIDATGWDNYSSTPGLCDYRDLFTISLHDGISRSATDQRFLIAERQAQVPAHADPDALRTLAYINLANGSFGSIYFEWRPPLTGQEEGYVSVLQMDGSFGPAKSVFIKMNKEFEKIFPQIKETKIEADIALLYSYQNQWEQGFWQQEGYDLEADRYFKALKTLDHNIDVISEGGKFSDYKVIAAPGLKLLSENTFSQLKNFVEDGGTLIINRQSGVKDTLNRYRPLLPPGLFREMSGIGIVASSSKASMYGNLMMGNDNQLKNRTFSINISDTDSSFEPRTIIEQIELEGAETLATANGGTLTGKSVITIHKWGKGNVVYVGSDCSNQDFYDAFMKKVAERIKISPRMNVPTGVDVIVRSDNSTDYFFVLNYTATHKKIQIPYHMFDLISGKVLNGEHLLEPFEVFILEKKKDNI